MAWLKTIVGHHPSTHSKWKRFFLFSAVKSNWNWNNTTLWCVDVRFEIAFTNRVANQKTGRPHSAYPRMIIIINDYVIINAVNAPMHRGYVHRCARNKDDDDDGAADHWLHGAIAFVSTITGIFGQQTLDEMCCAIRQHWAPEWPDIRWIETELKREISRCDCSKSVIEMNASWVRKTTM